MFAGQIAAPYQVPDDDGTLQAALECGRWPGPGLLRAGQRFHVTAESKHGDCLNLGCDSHSGFFQDSTAEQYIHLPVLKLFFHPLQFFNNFTAISAMDHCE